MAERKVTKAAPKKPVYKKPEPKAVAPKPEPKKVDPPKPKEPRYYAKISPMFCEDHMRRVPTSPALAVELPMCSWVECQLKAGLLLIVE